MAHAFQQLGARPIKGEGTIVPLFVRQIVPSDKEFLHIQEGMPDAMVAARFRVAG